MNTTHLQNAHNVSKACLQGAQLCSMWQLRIQDAPAGQLELYLAKAGYVWHWLEKPSNLVALAGVIDDGLDSVDGSRIPYRFFEFDSAIDHIMASTATAFRGNCCLHAIH